MQVQANRMCRAHRRMTTPEVETMLSPIVDCILGRENVLIYCKQGKNRSVFIMTLIVACWLGVANAVDHIQAVRTLPKPQGARV